MRAVVQRVKSSKEEVDGKVIGIQWWIKCFIRNM